MTGAIRWYPHREKVRSISPNAIAPDEWGFNGPPLSGMVNVPIWHRHPAAFYISYYITLHGYVPAPTGYGVKT